MIITPHRNGLRSVTILTVALLIVPSCSHKPSIEIAPTCAEMVAYRTNTLLRARTRDDAATRALAVKFGADLDPDTSRQETVKRWNAVPALAGLADLEAEIFEPVVEEEEWPEAATKDGVDPMKVPDATFVAGLKKGLEMLGKN